MVAENKWNDDQWDKLESYLVEFGNVNADNDYLYNFQLDFLCQYVGSDKQSIINHLQVLNHRKPGLSKNDFRWEGNKTKLINEVDNIISSLDLAPFKDITQPPIKGVLHHDRDNKQYRQNKLIPSQKHPQTPPGTVVHHGTQKAQLNPKQFGANIDQVLSEHMNLLDLDYEANRRLQAPSIAKVEMPKLSKAQRRTSLDLMHSRPNLSNDLGHRRTSSLSKPAMASTSNVNVMTKADVRTANKETPLKKFNLVLIIPKRKGHAPVKDAGVPDNHKKSSHLEGPSSDNKPQRNNSDDDTDKVVDKRSRRISLVGENLPNYIRSQIQSGSNDKTVAKKQSRMHNVLANSESLYAHNKDVASDKSDSHTGTSDYENYNDNSESEDDREYILPNLLTKYYDDLQEGEGEDDEEHEQDENGHFSINGVDNGFVNIDTQVSDDESKNTVNDNDTEDDYLFTV